MKNTTHNNHPEESSHAVHAISGTRRGLFWSFVLTAVFFVVELVVGLLIDSVAVIADAAHNFSAAAGLGIALLAIIFASKPPTPQRTYGFVKMEMFAAWINGFLLLAMAYLIIQMGIKKLLNPVSVATTPMLIVAIIGLIIGGIPAIMLYKKQKVDINVRGAFWHVMETIFGSAAVLVAALLMRYTGWLQADAVLGMLLAPLLIVAAWGIIKESTRTLLDLTPKHLDLLEIKKNIEKMPGVVHTHHIHAWTISTGKDVFTAHVEVADGNRSPNILGDITTMLKERYNIYFSTVQVETECTNAPAKEIDFV